LNYDSGHQGYMRNSTNGRNMYNGTSRQSWWNDYGSNSSNSWR
jgi:hypothetical protein